MPRPQRPLDPSDGPVQAFAAELRKLWQDAGEPKVLQMQRKTGRSKTALSDAMGGDHLPTWETVAAFVEYCGGDLRQWRTKWERTHEERRQRNLPTSDDGQPVGAGGPPKPAESGLQAASPGAGDAADPDLGGGLALTAQEVAASARRRLPYGLTVLTAAVVGSGLTLLGVALTGGFGTTKANPLPSPPPVATAAITVQNKVALGADRLVEDTTPAYLSTRPEPRCASNGCKVTGTEVASGAMLVAVCQIQGIEMFNYNLDSSESKQNPNRTDSMIWYKATFPDGRSGYISEVYIVASDRGGKGLPKCT